MTSNGIPYALRDAPIVFAYYKIMQRECGYDEHITSFVRREDAKAWLKKHDHSVQDFSRPSFYVEACEIRAFNPDQLPFLEEPR